jgi:hypothetical protein
MQTRCFVLSMHCLNRQVYDLLNGRSPVAFAASAARASSSRVENRLKNAQFDANGKWVAPMAMCVHITLSFRFLFFIIFALRMRMAPYNLV